MSQSLKHYMFTYNPSKVSEEVRTSLELISEDFPLQPTVCPGGIAVSFRICENGPAFLPQGEGFEVSGSTIPELLRALASLRGFAETGDIPEKYGETRGFDTLGLMLDASRDAVPTVSSVKHLLRRMALMGMNVLMLYTEDTYEVPGQPYIGYLRGRYSQSELRELDDYAFALGIEMFPCIQALAHLEQMLRWPVFASITDTEDILLVDEPKTYTLLEQMIAAASAPYRSKRIHIGMDEALELGLGKYRELNGVKPRFEIMNAHLNKVMEITRKLGLKPMIWSDMYFRLGSKTGDYYDPAASIPKDAIESIPKDVQLVYWDYYHPDKETYLAFIEKHRTLGSDPIFAPGIWTWDTFWLNFSRTRIDTCAGMAACREAGIREAITTAWGDDGAEADPGSMLCGLQVFADSGYHSDVTDEILRRQFMGSCGSDIDHWLLGSRLDSVPGIETLRELYARRGGQVPESVEDMADQSDKWVLANPSKFLLWQDPLLGLCDAQIKGFGLSDHYRKLARDLRRALRNTGDAEEHLRFALRLAEVLEDKAELGIQLQEAYLAHDTKALEELKSRILPRLIRRVQRMHEQHRRVWFATNKPNGWEVLDFRYGGLLTRLRSAMGRLDDYLAHRIEAIEELDEKKLRVYDSGEGRLPLSPGLGLRYRKLIGPSIWS
jgi:hypothetical protein